MIAHGEIIWKTKELLFLNFVLTNPLNNQVGLPKNWRWCYAEFFDRMVGINPGTAYHFRSKWQRNLEKEGGSFSYSYGDRFKRQLPQILKVLKRDYDREAIISVWDTDHLDRDTYARRPCTLTIQFYRRSGFLHCFVNMRSNDVINLLPYDVFHHTSLQIFLASILGLELGHYHHTCAQYYWPKKRELRNYGPTLLAKLQDSKPPENTHFPWVEPRKSIAQASRAVRQYVRLSTRGTSIDEDLSIPDPYIQSLVDFVTKGKTHETD